MTEQEWRECQDPNEMLAALRGKADERKQRLFACACWRLLWHLLDEPARRVVEAMERHADAPLAEAGELIRACAAANAAWAEEGGSRRVPGLRDAALQALLETARADAPSTRVSLRTQLLVTRAAGEDAGGVEVTPPAV